MPPFRQEDYLVYVLVVVFRSAVQGKELKWSNIAGRCERKTVKTSWLPRDTIGWLSQDCAQRPAQLPVRL
jgi:hypothetical protein